MPRPLAPLSEGAAASRPELIPRFRKAERAFHWSLAVPFAVCCLTGFSLKLFFDLDHASIVRLVVSWLHRLSGVCLIVLPVASVLRHRREFGAHLENVKKALTWTRDDVRWLALMVPAAVSSRVRLPDQHKFNAAEKINFTAVLFVYPLLATTGAYLLLPGIHFVVWIAHVAAAFAFTPVVVGHVFMATVNPGTRIGLSGMTTGYVDREWARHHYAHWYRENFDEEGRPRDAGGFVTRPPWVPEVIRGGAVPLVTGLLPAAAADAMVEEGKGPADGRDGVEPTEPVAALAVKPLADPFDLDAETPA